MAIYRRKNGSDTWHWCRNCANWPTSDFVQTYGSPTSGEFCGKCRGKEREGSCRSS